MKRILFDLTKTQPLNGTKFHGGGKYGIAVFKKLVECASDKIAAYYNESLYIDPTVMKLCCDNNIPVVKSSEKSITDAAKMFGGVLYSPLKDSAYLKDPSIRVIVTIHGLRVLEMPWDENEWRYDKTKKKSFFHRLLLNKNMFRLMLRKKRCCDYKKELIDYRRFFEKPNISFVTVSEHSKNSILSFVPRLNAENIKVFYSPSTIDNCLSTETFCNPFSNYFLIVSGNRWLKNSIRAIEALDELFSERPEIQDYVVVTGLKSFSDLSVKIRNRQKFIAVGYVDEIYLKSLYQNAKLFIYPSLNEGFGYPPLEAMHEGCPVIASAIASIPEVCGDAVAYFNPYSKAEIKMRVLQMMDENLRNQFVEKGKLRELSIEGKQEKDLCSFVDYLLTFVE